MIDVRLRLFIPSRAIGLPMGPFGSAFDGDNRGFSYDQGTSRAEIWIDVNDTPGAQNVVERVKHIGFGQSARYSVDKVVDVPGKPFWWKDLRRDPFLHLDPQPDAVATAEVRPDTLSVEGVVETDAFGLTSNAVLKLRVRGTNPLEPLAPPFDCSLDVRILRTGFPGCTYSVSGSHDGFPAYELYLRGRLVYSHDPVLSGSSPLALFQDGGVAVNIPMTVML